MAAIVLALVVIAPSFLPRSLGQASSPPSVRRLTLSPALAGNMVLSPDGKDLLYIGLEGKYRRIYHRRLDRTETTALPGTEGAGVPFFSPDGKWVGFASTSKAGSQLKKVRLAGGTPQVICDLKDLMVVGFTWGPDGSIVFGTRRKGLCRVSAQGGTPQHITTLRAGQENGHLLPQFLPGGKTVVFDIRDAYASGAYSEALRSVLSMETFGWIGTLRDQSPIGALSLETGESRRVAGLRGAYPRYSPSGHLLYPAPRSQMAVPFDVDTLEVTGDPVRLDTPEGLSGTNFVFSPDGTLIYRPYTPGSRLVWVDRQGGVETLASNSKSPKWPRLSHDGSRLLLGFGRPLPQAWTLDIADGTLSPWGRDQIGWGIWTPDGKGLTFGREGSIFRVSADGGGELERLTQGGETGDFQGVVPGSWSPGGQALAYSVGVTKPRKGRPALVTYDIWVLPVLGEARPFLATPANERAPVFSPDGRWLAFVSDRSGRDEIYVLPYPGEGDIVQISLQGGTEPAWRRGELFYRSGNQMMAVPVETKTTFQALTPRVLFEGSYQRTRLSSAANYDVTPDGQRFVMVQQMESPRDQLRVVPNWFEELKRLAPADN